MRVVLSGYFGFGNLGDEAVLAAMLAALRPRMPATEFTVLSADPQSTARQHGVRAVSRLGPHAFRAMAGADLVISGGGSLIQDVTSVRSPLYYLGMLTAGRALARRSMVYAQGIGPLRRRWLRTLTGWIGNRVDALTVRDDDSQRELAACGVRRAIDVVADPVFALPAAPPDRAAELLGPPVRPRVGVVLRSWGESGYVEPLLAAIRTIAGDAGAELLVLVFHPAKDQMISAQAARVLDARIVSGVTPQDMMAVIGTLDLVVGARLHALICAAVAGVSLIGLTYDPKVAALVRRIGAGSLLPMDALSAGDARQVLASAWAAREQTRAVLLTRVPELRRAALRAADLAAALAGFPSKPTE